MKFKPVNVDIDREGNTSVLPIEAQEETPKADAEGAEENQEENQDDSNDQDQDTIDASTDGADDDASADVEGDNDGSVNDGEEGSDEGADASGDSEELDGSHESDSEEDYEESEDEKEGISEEEIVDYDELPEAVQKYLEFLQDTNGSLEDFVRVNQDPSKLPTDEVISKFMKKQNPTLDADDIAFELQEKFGFDSDLDDEATIRRKTIAKKKFYGEALAALKADNEKYATSLVSSGGKGISKEAQEALTFKQNYEKQQTQSSTQIAKRRQDFVKETNKVLGKDFKGFEIDLGDGNSATYKPENVSKTKEQNLNVNNLLNRFTDKDGAIVDVKGYHKALTIASDPEGFAKHFYEMGKADMAETDAKNSKNINMNPRQTNSPKSTGGTKFKAVNVGEHKSGSGLKPMIKLRNY